jgi:hypothetical protein
MLRKQILTDLTLDASRGAGPASDTRDIPSLATVLVTSEAPGHPVDGLFDASRGPGGTRWVAATEAEQTLILAFDQPQTIATVGIEAEELERSRTQVLTLSLSDDGGKTYRERIRQEFNFSPPGTTFERESWAVHGEGITHLRLTIRPDKGQVPGRASLSSLTLR